MGPKVKKFFFLTIYLLSPIIASILYWIEEPVQFTLMNEDILMKLEHNIASILGIFSYIWMCFNIIIMVKVKVLEKNLELDRLINFHTRMAIIALFFGILHAPLLYFFGTYGDYPILSGLIGLFIFLIPMVLAFIFMTNRLVKFKIIRKLRVFAYKKKFRYNINKILHNITVLAVFIIFIHTVLGSTSASSMIMRIMYFFFFDLMIIGWVSHKLVRRIRPDSDPYIHRKALWDNNILEILEKMNDEWTLKLIEKFPSLYTCIQCGTCTTVCPVSTTSNGEYNPRKLIQRMLLGLKKQMIIEGPRVWSCTQCYSCIENCPQHLEFPEIIIYLRNQFAKRNEAPDSFLGEATVVYDFGAAVPPQPAISRRRGALKLPVHLPEYDIQEIQDILNSVGLNELVKKKKEEEIEKDVKIINENR